MADLVGGLAVSCVLLVLLLWLGVRADRSRSGAGHRRDRPGAGAADALDRYARRGIAELEEWLEATSR